MEAAQTGADAEDAEKRAKRDLDAQEGMAWWAMLMFFAAALTTIISGVGVFLIWRTLLHTRTAAEAGAEIVTVTRESAEAQLRAYVGIDALSLGYTREKERRLVVRWKNFGTTPANGLMLRVFTATPIEGEPGSRRLDLVREHWAGQLPPTQTATMTIAVENETIEAAQAAKTPLLWNVQWEYVDIFRWRRVCDAQLRCEHDHIAAGEVGAEGVNTEWTVGKVENDWQNQINESLANEAAAKATKANS